MSSPPSSYPLSSPDYHHHHHHHHHPTTTTTTSTTSSISHSNPNHHHHYLNTTYPSYHHHYNLSSPSPSPYSSPPPPPPPLPPPPLTQHVRQLSNPTINPTTSTTTSTTPPTITPTHNPTTSTSIPTDPTTSPTTLPSIPLPLTIQPTPYTSPLPPTNLNTPTYPTHSPPYYPTHAYGPQPAYQPSPPGLPNAISSGPSPPFSAYSASFRSPDPSYGPYPHWQEPYPSASPIYEPAYQHMNLPYLAFRDQPQPTSPRTDSAYPLAFSPPPTRVPYPDYQRNYREHPHPSSSPLHSPFTSPGPHTPHAFRSPNRPPPGHQSHHLPRYGHLAHRGGVPAAYTSSSSPSTHDQKSPTSPHATESLVRGSRAQATLRNHARKNNTSQPIPVPARSKPITHSTPEKVRHLKPLQRPALPRPPSHSEHALWVGNVPNDASHEELWKFFTGPPASINFNRPPLTHQPLSSAGVESIHLISRSNCAFVNYISDAHLQHAILTCNAKSLRPFDPRCKPLLCRVRKVEDNVKSGVGAQRIGGMHRTWIRKSTSGFNPSTRQTHPQSQTDEHFKRTSSTSTFHSNGTNSAGTASTTSSFLSKHFPRRYFILKSYTEDDLKLSVERSVWASQSHNEPILDQAFRTSSEGVYLIFSANRSGEFFGYARMTGPIWRPATRPASVPNSPISRPSLLTTRRASASGSLEHQSPVYEASSSAFAPTSNTIEKDMEPQTESTPLILLPPFEEFRITTASPCPISPSSPLATLGPPPLSAHTQISNARSLPEPVRTIPEHDSEQLESIGGGEGEDEGSVTGSVSNNGRPFEVEWIKVTKLPFHLTRDLKNPFNGHREVKVSRDGTEIEPGIGAALIARIDQAGNHR